ncbi:hypothetical protein Dtox_2982 [Desulfofarcimen acetoxidans DSM 771]|uniref:Uncharacterized protein n=1 Tax=Desulfofarcimen acetoxidans (strain ATCC 49208 / DSM 771 / KCTC 5769 / VKM B-1644 / 5575) TaxID=485916 RepID=C8W3F0_DESAS|nr:hypothetical protein [Desulfofarcimen acetoxidans]ACV63736.1 hypothetical protein Dtox_2982 [Desulfofarcimen acetoxidans DSM 771]
MSKTLEQERAADALQKVKEVRQERKELLCVLKGRRDLTNSREMLKRSSVVGVQKSRGLLDLKKYL